MDIHMDTHIRTRTCTQVNTGVCVHTHVSVYTNLYAHTQAVSGTQVQNKQLLLLLSLFLNVFNVAFLRFCYLKKFPIIILLCSFSHLILFTWHTFLEGEFLDQSTWTLSIHKAVFSLKHFYPISSLTACGEMVSVLLQQHNWELSGFQIFTNFISKISLLRLGQIALHSWGRGTFPTDPAVTWFPLVLTHLLVSTARCVFGFCNFLLIDSPLRALQ